MITRHRGTSLLWLLAFLLTAASAQPDSECHMDIGDDKYDFSALSGDHNVSRTRSSPPTNMSDTLRFNVCKELSLLEGVDAGDQCASGTWACLSKVNIKEGESDRVVAVIPMAWEEGLRAEYTKLSSPRGVKMTLHGPSYPSSTTLEPTPQTFVLNLLCDPETSDPVFKSYDGAQTVVEWSAPAGCYIRSAPEEEGDDKPEKETEAVGSGIGWFFLLLFVVFAGYFALGAYYNYTTYGATGVDLIPHRDFWREVPYMLRDVLSHLCSSFQSRQSSSRGGYMSV